MKKPDDDRKCRNILLKIKFKLLVPCIYKILLLTQFI